jgi:hypothetical protein
MRVARESHESMMGTDAPVTWTCWQHRRYNRLWHCYSVNSVQETHSHITRSQLDDGNRSTCDVDMLRLKVVRQRRAKAMKTVMKSAVKKRRRPGVFYSRTMPSNKQPLRNLVQPTYPHITTWSEAKCKAYMLGRGAFPRACQLTTQRCWNCGHKLHFYSARVRKAMKSSTSVRKGNKTKPTNKRKS